MVVVNNNLNIMLNVDTVERFKVNFTKIEAECISGKSYVIGQYVSNENCVIAFKALTDAAYYIDRKDSEGVFMMPTDESIAADKIREEFCGDCPQVDNCVRLTYDDAMDCPVVREKMGR